MKWTIVELDNLLDRRLPKGHATSIDFRGRHLASAARFESDRQVNCLTLRFDRGKVLQLDAAVDVSEALERSRVFIVEGKQEDAFLILGGEKAYWITADGDVRLSLPLFRKSGETEYWVSRIAESAAMMFFIYEAGILAIDEGLNVRWHRPKLFNDNFMVVENGFLKFSRDGSADWKVRCEDGVVVE